MPTNKLSSANECPRLRLESFLFRHHVDTEDDLDSFVGDRSDNAKIREEKRCYTAS